VLGDFQCCFFAARIKTDLSQNTAHKTSLNIRYQQEESSKMSKGNSRKGNREIKKPKKDTVKVLATANTMTNPGSIQLGTKKSK
jgi:hypothetical protein